MEMFVLVCLIAIVAIRWVYMRERLEQIESQLQELSLTVASLPRATAPEPKPAPKFEPAATPPAPKPAPPPPPPPKPAPVVVVTAPKTPEPAFTRTAAAPPRSSEDWEATLGGNWLNKIGVFVLVIGIALALAYSYTRLHAPGRVALSLAISAAMLISGVVVERMDKYRVFARGLIGGGWAALYFTVYAMQALDAARVISNLWLGAILLLIVAIGMIVHSLRYQSQAVTGLAYFIAFVTLGITHVTALSLAALIPLAGSLLYIAHRFRWSRMALFGLIGTYTVCATRPDTGAPLWEAQTIFAVYWLIFEAFDILSAEFWLMPLNAIGFLGLSIFKWNHLAPDQLWMLLAATAAAYLVGAILRARNAYWQAPITLSAALAAVAMFLKLDHQWVALGWMLEAELLYLAGVRLRAGYLRVLAAGLFGAEVAQLLAVEVGQMPVRDWTPVAALTAVVFYVNRALRSDDVLYGFGGAAMLALAAGYESPAPDRATVWLVLALAPLALGWWRRLTDFRLQGYLLAVLGLGAAAFDLTRLSLSVAAAVSYGLALCALLSPADRFVENERDTVSFGGSVAASLAMATLIWRVVPAEYLGLSWMAMALLLLELGLRGMPKYLCRQAYVLAAAGAALSIRSWQPHWVDAAAAILAYAMAVRARNEERGMVRVIAAAAGTALATAALWRLLPSYTVASSWALYGLVLLVAARRLKLADLRRQSYVMAAMAFIRCWYINFESGSAPLATGAIVIACLYAAQLLSRQHARIYFSLLATTLLSLLPYYQSPDYLRTVVWGLEGVVLLGSGFPLRDRILRLSGLTLLLGCILKLFVWDLRHLDTGPRILSFLMLGLFLVGVSWVYTRFRERVAQYL